MKYRYVAATGVFPACAGVIPHSRDVKPSASSVPRVRGGDPHRVGGVQ